MMGINRLKTNLSIQFLDSLSQPTPMLLSQTALLEVLSYFLLLQRKKSCKNCLQGKKKYIIEIPFSLPISFFI